MAERSAAGPIARIIGVGEVAPRRWSDGETTLGEIARVARAACLDAGLAPGDVDGLMVGPQVGETPQHVPATVAEHLGLQPRVASVVDLGGATGPGMIWRAAAAISAGMCETVLCVLGCVRTRTPPVAKNRNPIRELDVPFGASGANVSYAMNARAHQEAYGTSAESLAEIAVRARQNALLHPTAIFRDQPITVDDVLTSPMVADPIHKLEAVMVTAGAQAVVVTAADDRRRTPHPAVHVLGAGERLTHRARSQAPSHTSGPLKEAMADALGRAGTGLPDLGLLSLYDCYTIVVGITLEDLGVCPPGTFGDWVRDHDLGHLGDAPLNTHGGQLGYGQPDLAGGMTHVTEAVHQLRGTADGRQVPDPRLAMVTGNGATLGEACALVLGGAA